MANLTMDRVANTSAVEAFPYAAPVYLPLGTGASTMASFGPYQDQPFLLSLNNSNSYIFSEKCTQYINTRFFACSFEPTNSMLVWDLETN